MGNLRSLGFSKKHCQSSHCSACAGCQSCRRHLDLPMAPLLVEVDIKHLFRSLSSLQHPLCCDLKASSKDKAV